MTLLCSRFQATLISFSKQKQVSLRESRKVCEDNAGDMLAVEEWAIIRDPFAPSNFLLASVSDSKVLHSHHPADLHIY